ncbi:MAG: hypothetical protein HBSAPP02_01030 [Phycisphaerae bacterium]|nr:MAG: hypothetical protein HBSAPP02_01030 [Phycisphaerae bacterium]
MPAMPSASHAMRRQNTILRRRLLASDTMSIESLFNPPAFAGPDSVMRVLTER